MDLNYYTSVLLGSILSGAVIGAIPAICGAIKGKVGRGIGGFFACIVSSLILGMILAIPCCAIFLFFIFKKSNVGVTTSSAGVTTSPAMDNLLNTFDQMTISQKRSYIDKLKARQQELNNATYTIVLNECIQKYNTEMRAASLPRDSLQTLKNDVPSRNSIKPLAYNIQSVNYTLAESYQRFLAYLIDSLIQLPIIIMLYIPNFLIIAVLNQQTWALILSIVSLIGALVYSVFLLVLQLRYMKKNTTFGKNKMNLIVVKKDSGEGLSFGMMFVREVFGKMISNFFFCIGFVWILFDSNKQAWHDKLVSSVVINK